MTYICFFDDMGHRVMTYPNDNDMTPKRKSELLAKGYIEISGADYNYYAGNMGGGANGTGYIRGKNGKPTDAPAYVPTVEEKKQVVISQYEADKDELVKYYADAALHDDDELMEDLKAEMTALDEKFAEDMKELEG